VQLLLDAGAPWNALDAQGRCAGAGAPGGTVSYFTLLPAGPCTERVGGRVNGLRQGSNIEDSAQHSTPMNSKPAKGSLRSQSILHGGEPVSCPAVTHTPPYRHCHQETTQSRRGTRPSSTASSTTPSWPSSSLGEPPRPLPPRFRHADWPNGLYIGAELLFHLYVQPSCPTVANNRETGEAGRIEQCVVCDRSRILS